MSDQDAIDQIMDNFDFRKVADTMEKIGWHWARLEGPPDEHELRRVARGLLKKVAGTDMT